MTTCCTCIWHFSQPHGGVATTPENVGRQSSGRQPSLLLTKGAVGKLNLSAGVEQFLRLPAPYIPYLPLILCAARDAA
jgi:hypothetical protein